MSMLPPLPGGGGGLAQAAAVPATTSATTSATTRTKPLFGMATSLSEGPHAISGMLGMWLECPAPDR
jgi:hypothetical protein